MRKTASLGLMAALSALMWTGAAAAITVPIDQSVRLSVQGSAASVLVGNSAIADVTVVDSRTLFISGRGFGSTDVVVLDALGRSLYTGQIVVAAPQGGQVSVYRGGARTDMACAPGCQVALRSHDASAGGGGASGGGGGGSSSGSAAPSIGGGLSGVANAVGAATSSAAPPPS